jgi:hypothetical protein
MNIAIMQPYLFPYIGYWQLMNVADKFVLLDDVNYIKRGWINRNKLRSGRFTIPLKEASQNKKIRELSVVGDHTAFYRALEVTYKNAPYYNEVRPLLDLHGEKISSVVYHSIKNINDYLGIRTEIVSSSSLYNNQNLSGQQRIVHICLLEQGKTYINPINGWDLYNDALFKQYGLKLTFLKSRVDNNLSIIDLLMHNSKEEVQSLLQQYEFISKTL